MNATFDSILTSTEGDVIWPLSVSSAADAGVTDDGVTWDTGDGTDGPIQVHGVTGQLAELGVL